MAIPVQFSKMSSERPAVGTAAGVNVRAYKGCDDIDDWLNIRNTVFSSQYGGEKMWMMEDFEREFLQRSWWRKERMWFAEVLDDSTHPKTIGTITWGERGTGPHRTQTVQWLAVLPEWRGRGIGRMLLATVEAACWDAGYREISLETLPAWQAAMRLYESAGYRPIRAVGQGLP